MATETVPAPRSSTSNRGCQIAISMGRARYYRHSGKSGSERRLDCEEKNLREKQELDEPACNCSVRLPYTRCQTAMLLEPPVRSRERESTASCHGNREQERELRPRIPARHRDPGQDCRLSHSRQGWRAS
ncbi:hypothetical protein TESG_03366 [Trichophyton tonsurans CBS 112818]|uniref:Uncharacterized protein n=1 Tax=Trichophyton tonsurans (strain CBS 112818) TaxID=647933 RepID=F2RXB9_TRIT1|nr:hypothetical protein TESG_03366 [Trichophyton tonsurans CBS 112818]